jgi:hypothetical protein
MFRRIGAPGWTGDELSFYFFPAAFFISHWKSPWQSPLAAFAGADAPLVELPSDPLLVVPEPSDFAVFLRPP